MEFKYFNPVEIIFNVNFMQSLESILPSGETLLLTTKTFIPQAQRLQKHFNIKNVIFIPPNPTLNFISQNWECTRDFTNIIALGGGSVIDAAKAFCLQINFTEFENLLKYGKLDSIESKIKKSNIFAIPTTAGTGSELTPWATIWDKDERFQNIESKKANINSNDKKYSLHLCDLYCKVAIYDISLMQNMPRSLTIHTALDALSHAIESIWNKNANPISSTHAKIAIKLITKDLPRLVKILDSMESKKDSKNTQIDASLRFSMTDKAQCLNKTTNLDSKKIQNLRQNLSLASIHAALAFSNTKTALAHAISYPLTMNFDMPHGLACSFSLPLLLEIFLKYSKDSKAIKILKPQQNAINKLFKSIKISTNFKDYGITKHDIESIFKNLNARADNFSLDSKIIKNEILKRL